MPNNDAWKVTHTPDPISRDAGSDCAESAGSADYLTFGEEWEKLTMRLPKRELVELLRKQGRMLESIREDVIEPLRRNLTKMERDNDHLRQTIAAYEEQWVDEHV